MTAANARSQRAPARRKPRVNCVRKKAPTASPLASSSPVDRTPFKSRNSHRTSRLPAMATASGSNSARNQSPSGIGLGLVSGCRGIEPQGQQICGFVGFDFHGEVIAGLLLTPPGTAGLRPVTPSN